MDNTITTTAEPSVALDTSAAQPPQAAPPPAAAPSQSAKTSSDSEKPHWLDARLERERKAVLRDLGVEDVEAAKAALAELAAKREGEKSAAQRAAELDAALKAERETVGAMRDALNAFASGAMAALSEAQRAAVTAVAGDDPAKQVRTIEAMRPTWAASAAAPEAPAPPSPPADTAPARGAPSDGGGVSPPDTRAVYDELRKTNPIIAARYAQANGLHI